MDSKALFTGTPQKVETEADKERAPDLFLAMRAGQASKLVYLGWVSGGLYGDQPVFFSPVLNRTVALPAHTILCDKLDALPKFSPVIVECTRAGSKETGAAWRYNVQAFPPVADDATLTEMREEYDGFLDAVAALRSKPRGGSHRTAAGPGLQRGVEPQEYDF